VALSSVLSLMVSGMLCYAENDPKAREQEKKQQQRIYESFRSGPFEEIVARSEAHVISRISFLVQYLFISFILNLTLMGDLMDNWSLIGNGKTVIEMISDLVLKLIGDQYDQPSNVHGKTGHYCSNTSSVCVFL